MRLPGITASVQIEPNETKKQLDQPWPITFNDDSPKDAALAAVIVVAEPNLGMLQDALVDSDDAIGLTVDLCTHADLELFFRHGVSPLSTGYRI